MDRKLRTFLSSPPYLRASRNPRPNPFDPLPVNVTPLCSQRFERKYTHAKQRVNVFILEHGEMKPRSFFFLHFARKEQKKGVKHDVMLKSSSEWGHTVWIRYLLIIFFFFFFFYCKSYDVITVSKGRNYISARKISINYK